MRRFLLAILALLPLAATAACDDATNPFDEVTLRTDTTDIFLRTPLAGRDSASALDGVVPRAVRPELPEFAGQWDFALRQSGNTLSLITLKGLAVGAAPSTLPLIARSTRAFDDIEEASRRRSDYSDSTIVLVEGAAYTYRTRQYTNSGGGQCFNYGKLRVIDLDEATGTARLGAAVNSRCDDERLTED